MCKQLGCGLWFMVTKRIGLSGITQRQAHAGPSLLSPATKCVCVFGDCLSSGNHPSRQRAGRTDGHESCCVFDAVCWCWSIEGAAVEQQAHPHPVFLGYVHLSPSLVCGGC